MASCLMLLGRSSENFYSSTNWLTLFYSKESAVLVDAGANVDEKASVLVDFAIAGSVFAEILLRL